MVVKSACSHEGRGIVGILGGGGNGSWAVTGSAAMRAVAVGFIAGFSSGFLGIGGGLAITAGLSAGLRVPQHQAQLVSLVFSIIPMTIPAAWIYWRNGWSARENTNGSTGRMHGLKIVRTRPTNASK